MSKNGDNQEQVSPNKAGIEGGLSVGLFFAFVFYWLGYNALVSVFLAAIAGVSSGCMVAWWQITDEQEHDLSEVTTKTLAYKTTILSAQQNKTGLLQNKEEE